MALLPEGHGTSDMGSQAGAGKQLNAVLLPEGHGSAVSLRGRRTRQCRVPTDLTDSRNDRKTQNCDKHNQGIKLSATALKVFQTFARNQGDQPC